MTDPAGGPETEDPPFWVYMLVWTIIVTGALLGVLASVGNAVTGLNAIMCAGIWLIFVVGGGVAVAIRRRGS